MSWTIEVVRAFEPGAGATFVEACIDAVQTGEWGCVSFSEAEQNETAVRAGGNVWAAFEIHPMLLRDQSLGDPEVLVIEITNAGTNRAATLARFIPTNDELRFCPFVTEVVGNDC